MIFEGFYPESFQFLLELSVNNNKSWFEMHREDYVRYLKQPFLALEETIRPFLLELDPRVRTGPLALSRIYRDTRFSKDKQPLRDHLWLGYKPPKTRTSEFFSLFVSITPVSYNYGMGMYAPSPAFMQYIREKILAAPASFLSIVNQTSLVSNFQFESESYVRTRYHHENPEIEQWLNRKGFFYLFSNDDCSKTMSPAFADEVLKGFTTLAPMYRWIHGLS